MSRKPGTKTEKFGSKGRENHDSSEFYESRLYQGIDDDALAEKDLRENPITVKILDQIFCSSAETMDELPDNSIHLMVTSPPYNVGKDYDEDLSLTEYLGLLRNVFKEVYRVLAPGGRAAVNLANLGRKPYIPLNSHVARIMLDIGFLMRGEIIWDKSASAGSSTAWGSWKSASNPTLRDVHEYILVFSKGKMGRSSEQNISTISRDQFLEYTKSIWSFPTESASRVGHPAPFPAELPKRLIQLYTFESDIVLDPFMGSGTTAVSALQEDRHFIGYDINEDYIAIAKKRLEQTRAELAQLSMFGK